MNAIRQKKNNTVSITDLRFNSEVQLEASIWLLNPDKQLQQRWLLTQDSRPREQGRPLILKYTVTAFQFFNKLNDSPATFSPLVNDEVAVVYGPQK